MGSMASHIAAIDELHFDPFPRRVIQCRLVRRGNTLMGITARGRLLTNCPTLRDNACCVPAEWPWLGDVLDCLLALGVITAEHMAAHRERCSLRESQRNASEALKYLPKQLAELGIALTPEQTGVLREKAGAK